MRAVLVPAYLLPRLGLMFVSNMDCTATQTQETTQVSQLSDQGHAM